MAIRTISYSVKSDGISPNTEQQAGLQSEHAVTQLVFTLDSTLYQALLSEKDETDTLVYRFDCCDSMGGAVKTEPSALTSDTVTFTVGENLTRSGGKARVYLVISRYNAEEKTETELLSFPAKLRFENVPETDSDNGDSRESLSTLTEAAKNAAARAEQSADTAVEAQGKTEAARLAIEGDSTVIFDGNGTYGEMDVDFVVDTELSEASDNAIANKTVTAKFESTDNDISAIQQLINAMWSKIYPIGSIYISTVSTSPSTLFGGTWEQIKGRFLLAAGENEANTTTDFGSMSVGELNRPVGELGGEVTHTLTEAELASHIHQIRSDGGAKSYLVATNGSGSDGPGYSFDDSSHDYDGNTSGAFYATATGGNQPHNNMPPYLAVYVWKRTA